ncbi:MAG: thioredoxin family protein [Chloroflexi bacterium]|nr:thioredoxin family protein [Chloroflexota bacterium]
MLLEIVVASDCPGCDEARAIAEEIRSRFPDVGVDLLEVGRGRPMPATVFATPTYLLDGVVAWLGNPSRQQLAELISARLAAKPARSQGRER